MISIILLDSEIPSLNNLKSYLANYEYVNICGMYTDSNQFLKDFTEKSPDAVFLHMDSPQTSRIETAINIHKMNRNTKVFFVKDQKGYALNSFELDSLEHILKPIEKKQFKKSIIKFKKKCSPKLKKSIEKSIYYVNCFKKFNLLKKCNYTETFKWRTKKVKELLAYLICHYEKSISKDELVFVLFEGEEKKKAHNNLYVIMSYLRKQLQEFGIDRNKLLIKGDYTLEIADGICDFVDFDRFLKSNVKIDSENIRASEKMVELYKGMFLEEEDYLWAYQTREYLDQKYEELLLAIGTYYKEHQDMKKSEKALLKILSTNPLSYSANTQLLDLYMDYDKPDLFIKHFTQYSKLLKSEFHETPEKRHLKKYQMLTKEDEI